jgi:hypothetical protein
MSFKNKTSESDYYFSLLQFFKIENKLPSLRLHIRTFHRHLLLLWTPTIFLLTQEDLFCYFFDFVYNQNKCAHLIGLRSLKYYEKS